MLGPMPSAWLQRANTYWAVSRPRLIPFLVIGGTAFLVNWGLFKLFRVLGMTSQGLVFVAFLLSMECAILYNFTLQYVWTWRDTARLRGWRLLAKLAAFHGAVGVGALLRTVLFPLGQFLQVQDDVNLIVGVGVAALFDFVLYDKIVFKKAHS